MIDDSSKTDVSGFVDRADDDDEKEEILKEFGRETQAYDSDPTRSTLHYGSDYEGVNPDQTADNPEAAAHTESFTIDVADVNEGPTDISLSGATIAENAAGATVGTLSVVDPDAADSHSFSVSDDRFEVVNGELRLREGVALDHETAATIDVEVTATDSAGLATSQTFTIQVADLNEGPKDRRAAGRARG